MTLDIQFKLKENPNYLKYLRENSNWYKTLNRYPSKFNDFINEVKVNYKLRPTDQISKVIDTFDMLQNIFKVIK